MISVSEEPAEKNFTVQQSSLPSQYLSLNLKILNVFLFIEAVGINFIL